MKKSIAGAIVLLAFASSPARALPLGGNAPPLFSSAQSAQAHCPSDIVVWLDLETNVYHARGQRLYGKTKSGGYVCKGEALLAGVQPSRNGQ